MRSAIVLLTLLLTSSAASAQPSIGVFGEYVYSHPDFEDVHVSTGDSLNGWLGGVDVVITRRFGITARADGSVRQPVPPGCCRSATGRSGQAGDLHRDCRAACLAVFDVQCDGVH